MHAARGGYHDDIGVRASRDGYEALQDVAIVFFILGTADWNYPTPTLIVGNFAGH
jgi:hypothetical protein